MTNEQLAELRDPEHRMPGWWCESWCYPSAGESENMGDIFTGPDWHADDLACFRDWRPVLLAAGCVIGDSPAIGTAVWLSDTGPEITESDAVYTYRAAILAAVAWLAEHKPELLREAIAQVVEGK